MKKILLIDDIEEITELLTLLLKFEFSDFETIECISGNQGIEYLKNDKEISLVICDHNMPDGTGSDVYSFIKENNLNIPYIHMSTSPQVFTSNIRH
ncbi:MAG: response regulator [Bacteriovoracaceae bacterium]|nr:response regulator [Bacteriovoracaceae bacterium]